ncbi:MAG: TIGR01244 family phosphatase [Betaproteobacteria bacterium]|nr:TIGR01244 family phosphatase [Betaproteobacteria bacterium]NBP45246.1 TIGR01244 family phosphatase [Betaproteobacteria bacterium]
METQFLTPELSVAAQISVADLAGLAQAGFKSIICNRPDGEAADQTAFDDIAKAAVALGLHARFLPAETGKVSDEQGAAFGKLMDELPKPILAYCRSGMRSTTLWALASAGKLPLPSILNAAERAGYDLNGLAHRISNAS